MGDAPPAGELAYIANLLEGNAAPQGPACAPRGRGRGRGPQRGRGGRGRGGRAGPFPVAGPSTSAAATTAPADSDPLNQPRESSSPKLWHCETCDVLVPRRPGDWEVHVAGIRHRRQVLSIREHGERGRLVLSVFESRPQLGAQGDTRRLAGNAAGAFGLEGEADAAAAGFHRLIWSGDEYEVVKAARTAILAQILNVYGRGRVYDAAATQDLTEQKFGIFSKYVPIALEQEDVRKRVELMKSYTSIPGALAYLATAHRRGALPAPLAPLLAVRMAFDTHDGHSGTVAGWICALILLFDALAEGTSPVRALWIAVRADYGVNSSIVSHTGWPRVITALRRLLESPYCELEEIRIYFEESNPDRDGNDALMAYILGHDEGLAPMDDSSSGSSSESEDDGSSEESDSDDPEDNAEDSMITDTRNALPEMRAAIAEVASARRLAVAMATHPRLGRCSALQLLPTPVLEQIALTAAPRGGCRIRLLKREMPDPGPEVARWL